MPVARSQAARALDVAAVATLFTAPAAAGDDELWTAAFLNVAPTPSPSGARLWLDVHDRRNAAGTGLLLRPGVGWQFSPRASLFVGYAWTPSFPDDGDIVGEHRIWEQVSVQHAVGKVKLSARLRGEHRVRVGEDGLNHRARLQARVGIPVAGPVSLQVWDEVFVSFNETDWFAVQGYDQNRLFIGPSVDGFPGFRAEVGYLNQDLARGEASANNHVVSMNLFFTLAPKDEGRGR